MAEEIKAKVAQIQAEKYGVQKKEISVDELEWIQLNKTLAAQRGEEKAESPTEKLKRKFMENPLIPVGVGLTTFCLISGLTKFARKDSSGSQTMMRGRIAAQGFTVFAMLVGVFIQFKKTADKRAQS